MWTKDIELDSMEIHWREWNKKFQDTYEIPKNWYDINAKYTDISGNIHNEIQEI